MVKHKSDLNMGHAYIDTPHTVVDNTAKVIERIYDNDGLEKR